MSDQIEVFGSSVIQHGKSNDRAYVMKICPQDCPTVVDDAVNLAIDNRYSKIFAKAPAFSRQAFLQECFVEEAKVPNLFNGAEDGYFLSKFMFPERRREGDPEIVKKVIATANSKFTEVALVPELDADFTWRIMQKHDTQVMAQLYKRVFKSYPFPINDPDYLVRTMDEDVVYHGIFKEGELIALSSAEIDFSSKNVEMTDFATRPDCRGQGLATYLLEKMETDVRNKGICTAYTIARAYSYGMNITFAKHGYSFAGTLTNNTQISGQLESMNVWYKTL